MALAAAVIGAGLGAAVMNAERLRNAFVGGFAGSLLTLVGFFVLLFLVNLVRAGKAVRRRHTVAPGVAAQVFFTSKVREIDMMQRYAAHLAESIEVHLAMNQERQRGNWPNYERRLRSIIDTFEERIEHERWITRKSRKRSRLLMLRIRQLQLAWNLQGIVDECRRFQHLRPSV